MQDPLTELLQAALTARQPLIARLHEEDTNAYRPVSYTHLDVYKRQHLAQSDWPGSPRNSLTFYYPSAGNRTLGIISTC